MLMSTDLLKFSEDDRTRILKIFNRTPNSVQKDVEAIKNWLKTQPHLPDLFTDERIERFLVLNKLSIEKTKQKIDMYYTIRKLVPDIYKGKEPWQPQIKQIAKMFYFIPLPQLTKELYRVVISKMNEPNPDLFDPICYFAHILNVAEVRLDHDFLIGEICIWDMRNVSLSHLKKITPVALKKVVMIVEKVFANRLKGLHFVYAPSYMQTFIGVVKSVLKPKFSNRIHAHKNMDSLYNHVEREILPKEYGGCEKSLDELHEKWCKLFVEYEPWFKKLSETEVNEKLRPGKPVNEDIFGMHGNFRQLDLD